MAKPSLIDVISTDLCICKSVAKNSVVHAAGAVYVRLTPQSEGGSSQIPRLSYRFYILFRIV
jgi:hypothetical protein